MSWNGTVRCSHCYKEGHNQRGCPSLKEHMEARLANDPDDWRAKQYFEKKKGAKVRRCTYCNLKGHNRATCPELKGAVSEWKHKNSNWRKAVIEELLAAGIGVGALIKHGDLPWRMTEKKNLVMVAGVHREAHVDYPYAPLLVQGIINPTQKFAAKLPAGVETKVYEKLGLPGGYNGTSVTVMSETKNCHLRVVAEEWIKGGDTAWIKREIFKDKKSDDFWENKYKD